MENVKTVKLGNVTLVEAPANVYNANIEIDGEEYQTCTHDLKDGLEFIFKMLDIHCNGKEIVVKGNSKRRPFELAMGYAENGNYVIEARARKSSFILCESKKDDCAKVLKEIDSRFPRQQLREFIGKTAREVLKLLKENSV